MIGLGRRSVNVNRRTLAYGGLCLVMICVGWVSVVLVGPPAGAGLPTPSAPGSMAPQSVDPTASAITGQPAGSPSVAASITPVAAPTRTAFYMDIYRPGSFVSQSDREGCMAGAVQNMLNIISPTIDLSITRQEEIRQVLVSLTTQEDSHDGGAGPAGWALAMPQLGGGQYQLLVDPSFEQAMKDAALALARTSRPVGLLTWWGAHSWVMTGFRADADPLLFPSTFKLKGAFVVDPFYPRLSTIWGQTLGPDTFYSMTSMAHNFLYWKRPDGPYPTRDGKWLLVVPVEA